MPRPNNFPSKNQTAQMISTMRYWAEFFEKASVAMDNVIAVFTDLDLEEEEEEEPAGESDLLHDFNRDTKLLRVINDALGLPTGTINMDSAMLRTRDWDVFTHTTVLEAVEREFQLQTKQTETVEVDPVSGEYRQTVEVDPVSGKYRVDPVIPAKCDSVKKIRQYLVDNEIY